jgi:hypothetical protein
MFNKLSRRMEHVNRIVLSVSNLIETPQNGALRGSLSLSEAKDAGPS